MASPQNDADALMAHLLGVDWGEVHAIDSVTEDMVRRYLILVERRAERVPLQHITGVAGFRRLQLAVGPGVFVPRPETEVLVEWGLQHLRDITRFAPVVVDLCAGSGAIALSIRQEIPDAQIYAVERDEKALTWAHRNAEARLAAGDLPITLCRGDATSPRVLMHLDCAVDLALSNPPYIPFGAEVEPEVVDHDPPAALWGGVDGLDVVRGVSARAQALLKTGGWFGVEHADLQGEVVPALLCEMGGWADVTDQCDLAGRPRFTIARKA